MWTKVCGLWWQHTNRYKNIKPSPVYRSDFIIPWRWQCTNWYKNIKWPLDLTFWWGQEWLGAQFLSRHGKLGVEPMCCRAEFAPALSSLHDRIYVNTCNDLCPSQWCHNECDGISNHQPHDCLLSRLFRHRSKKTSKLRITGLCAGNSPVIGEFPAQRASNAENVQSCQSQYSACSHLCPLMSTQHSTLRRVPERCSDQKKKVHLLTPKLSSLCLSIMTLTRLSDPWYLTLNISL